jgi:hypothetical protein
MDACTQLEQAIRDLCLQLLNAKDSEEAEVIGEQLRSAIHEHMADLRRNVVAILPAL